MLERAALDQTQRIEEGDDAAGAGCDLGLDRPGQAVLHRQQAGGHGAGKGRDGEGAHEAGPARLGDATALDDLLEATAAGVDHDRDAVALLGRPVTEVEPGIGHGLLARSHGEVDEAAHASRHLAVHARGRIEVLDLGGDAHVEVGGVEGGDGPTAAHARLGVGPERGMVVADGRDRAEAGDDGATGWIGVGHRSWTPT
jgi:hypothetical protein